MNDEVLVKWPEEVIRKLKTLKHSNDYFQKLYKQVIDAILKAEMGEHPGYPQSDPYGKKHGHSRNGYTGKTLKTNLGETLLDVPRDRNPAGDQ